MKLHWYEKEKRKSLSTHFIRWLASKNKLTTRDTLANSGYSGEILCTL
jgi:hypothetical protein